MTKWSPARDEKVTLNHLAVFCFMFFVGWGAGNGGWWYIVRHGWIFRSPYEAWLPNFAGFEPIISRVRNAAPSHALPSFLSWHMWPWTATSWGLAIHTIPQVLVSINFFCTDTWENHPMGLVVSKGLKPPPRCWNFYRQNYPRQAGGGIFCWHLECQWIPGCWQLICSCKLRRLQQRKTMFKRGHDAPRRRERAENCCR